MKLLPALLPGLFLVFTHLRAQEEQRPEEGAAALAEGELPAHWTRALKVRAIGPAVQGGRITAIAVQPGDATVSYIGAASGGVFKTTDGGVSFEPIFDGQSAMSIGAICVAPSDPQIVWVGTGEANVRNSVSWGNGVYRSSDGGKSWKHMGLAATRHIARIAIHPSHPEIVYVAAAGRMWGENPERGLFKTTDGGKSWKLVLALDERTGCNEVRICPGAPETLLAALYERQRDATDSNDPAKRWGPGSGLYKSIDGGESWKRLERGLPTVAMGRICVDYYRAKPSIVYSIIETERWATSKADVAPGKRKPRAWLGLETRRSKGVVTVKKVVADGPCAQADLRAGDQILRVGKKKIHTSLAVRTAVRKMDVGSKVTVTVRRGEEELEIEVALGAAPAGELGRPFTLGLGGQRGDLGDKQGADGYQSGGVFRSDDGGESWTRVNSLNPRPYYFSQIRVDPQDAKHVYVCGTNLHHSADGGKSFSSVAGRGTHLDHHAMWIDPEDGRHLLIGNDGGVYETFDRCANWAFVNTLPIGQYYHVAVDHRLSYRVYGGLQDNGSWGGPSMLRGRAGPTAADWFQIGGGDGFVCAVDAEDPDLVYYESQGGGMGRINLRTGEGGSCRPRREEGLRYHFNWKTPFLLSHHNSRIFYCAGNYVFRSLDRGRDGRRISEKITRTEGASATALAESPRDPDVLYVGTEDGMVWGTRDGGHHWVDLGANLPDLPGPRWVSSIEASRHSTARAYLTLDGHRSNDDAPYVFVTENYGKSWKSLVANLPPVSTKVVREDLENRDLLYLGTEFGMFLSIDRGKSWVVFDGDLPRVPVHEFALHPRMGEAVIATHGRSLWILDVMPLRKLSAKALKEPFHLFEPATAVIWAPAFSRRLSGHRHFIGQNRVRGAVIWYLLRAPAKKVILKVLDPAGKELSKMDQKDRALGLHRAIWNLRLRDGTGERTRGRRRPRYRRAAPGQYRLVLEVDGKVSKTRNLELIADPEGDVTIGTGYIRSGPIR